MKGVSKCFVMNVSFTKVLGLKLCLQIYCAFVVACFIFFNVLLWEVDVFQSLIIVNDAFFWLKIKCVRSINCL